MGRGVDASDRPRDEDLGAEPACLLERPARQLVARHARGEAEVVLDPGGRARLAAGCLALDHDRPEPLGRAVHGGRQAGRPRADDHRVVLRGRRLGRDLEELGHPPKLRSHRGLAVHDANGGEVALGRQRARPLLRFGGHVRLEPSEPDLVAVEEAPQLRAGGVPALAEDDRPERGRCGRAGLQAFGPAEPVLRQETHPLPDLRRGGDERVVVVQIDPEHARRLRCAEPAGVEHPERDRHLRRRRHRASARRSRCRRRRRACAPRSDPRGRRTAPARRPRSRRTRRDERDVRHDPGKPVAFGRLEVREHGDATDLLRRHHQMRRRCKPRLWRNPPPMATALRRAGHRAASANALLHGLAAG